MKRSNLHKGNLTPNFIGSWIIDPTLCEEIIEYFEKNKESFRVRDYGNKLEWSYKYYASELQKEYKLKPFKIRKSNACWSINGIGSQIVQYTFFKKTKKVYVEVKGEHGDKGCKLSINPWGTCYIKDLQINRDKTRKIHVEVNEQNKKSKLASNQTKDPSNRPLAHIFDTNICYYATFELNGKKVWNYTDRGNFVGEAKYRGLTCGVKEQNKTNLASKPKNTKPSISSVELERERAKILEEEESKRKALEQRIAELEKKNKELQQPKKKQPAKPKSSSGSGFFISKLGHIITNQHVVNKCNKITIGDHIDKQVPAKLIEADRVNDLALLRTTNIKMASAETQSLIRKLSIQIVPLASGGLMRKSDVKGGEDVIVAGFPYGVMFSKTIKVTKGIVSSTRGIGNDSGQFQIDAAVQPGNSGGPIYDRYGNIVGVVVAQLNKFKMAKSIGSLPENVNFGIKASTVSQFLNTSGVITNWAKRTKPVSNEKLFDIASKQTVMVVCHR